MKETKTKIKTVNEYIQSFPKDVQKILEQVRLAIKETAPEAEETISYKIPAFKLNGKELIYFAGWKNHISLYPKPGSNEAFTKQLSVYKGGKGTVQFPLDKSIPLSLIKRIVKFRIKENSEKIKKNK